MDTATHKKLVVFDVNLDWKEDTQGDRRFKDLPLVYSLINKAASYQTIVIQTTSCLIDAIDFINNQNITTGYIIASGGAVIYDVAKKQVVSSLPIENDDVRTIVHHGLMNNINVGIYTTDRKFVYVSNNTTYGVTRKHSYSEFDVITSYELLQKTLERSDIVDISYLMFLGSLDNQKQDKMLFNISRYFDGEQTNIVVKTNKTSDYVHIGHSSATKFNGILKIMELAGVQQLSDVLYIASTCVNNECYISFKNSLITSNTDFLNEIGHHQHKYLAEEINNLDPEFGLKTNSFWK